MSTESRPGEWLTVGEIAADLKVSEKTVRRWLQSGKLKGRQLGGDKLGWRIRSEELARFVDDGGARAAE